MRGLESFDNVVIDQEISMIKFVGKTMGFIFLIGLIVVIGLLMLIF